MTSRYCPPRFPVVLNTAHATDHPGRYLFVDTWWMPNHLAFGVERTFGGYEFHVTWLDANFGLTIKLHG